MMIRITDAIFIDEAELAESFVRASGPGGQNVNKVSSAVQLRFDVRHSPSLPNDVAVRLMRLAGKRGESLISPGALGGLIVGIGVMYATAMLVKI